MKSHSSFASSSSDILHKFLTENLRREHARADWIGLRHVNERATYRIVRNEAPERNVTQLDEGVMIEVLVKGHLGYAGTCDLSREGLTRALDRALESTEASAAHAAHKFDPSVRPQAVGNYKSPSQAPLDSLSLKELTDLLIESSRKQKASDLIVNRSARAMIVEMQSRYLSTSGSDTHQQFSIVHLGFGATAQSGSESQTRSMNTSSHQCGAEVFDRQVLFNASERIGREALELLAAPNCPTGVMDLIAQSDQMDLQIHESIGHPLELDRILGDERNYAGWSFVRPEDFGILQYGSKLMNVTFDPSDRSQMASYSFDDTGAQATRQFLIQDGLLQRGLGGLESQTRLNLPGVANSRASSWNRAPIDRMANINLEPGDLSMEQMIGKVKKGILMATNRSWSIDDYRRKFQFGCEYGRLIEEGKLGAVVKNPNYRGVTVPFWNKLAGVGHADLRQSHGTPYCGKGEPNQVIRVSHATPPCLFREVEVFGGES